MTSSATWPEAGRTGGSVLNQIVRGKPRPGYRISFARLDGVREMTLTDLHDASERLARGLGALGIRRGDRIGILAANSPEWALLDLAALRLGAVTAGFDPGRFDPDPGLLTRYRLAALFTDRQGADPAIRTTAEVASLIETADPASYLPAVQYAAKDVTTIKFTSGSTGEPKGLAATAGSIDASISAVQEMFGHGDGDNLFVFLPLSLLQQRYWIYSALRFGHDVTVSTYEAAFATLRSAAPTVVMAVPAFYETARTFIEAQARRDGAGGQHGPRRRAAAAGLFGDRIRYLWTGSAPARPSTLRFFTEAGMPIYEGYGLNETCIVSKNSPRAHREGSAGQVLPGKKVLIGADGVISVASEHPVNWRYEHAAPGESERVFGPDGIVRTGDLGHLDDDGFLFIHGRADDVIVLDNGKKVIVTPIEEYMRESPAIEECVLLCPAPGSLVAVVSPADRPADEEAIAARLKSANTFFSQDEQIRGVVIAPERFSIANGLLTSQCKPRRPRILQAHWRQVNAVQRGSADEPAEAHQLAEARADGF